MNTSPKNKGGNKALEVAYYFVKKNEKDKKDLNNKKLQKLLYYAQAWNLILNKQPLFSNKIEAWIHGPAILEIWQAFKDFDFNIPHPEITESLFNDLNEKETKLLDEIWRIYGKYDGNYLEVLAHNELPWQEARKGVSNLEPSQNEISLKVMEAYYEQKLKSAMAKNLEKNKE